MEVMWPKRTFYWHEGDTGYASVPFTWCLPDVKAEIEQSLFFKTWRVGGPAAALMPDYLAGMEGVTLGGDMPGILQRINPLATRTTVGCPNKCGFCGVKRIEPEYRELNDWPNLPIVCDNNLLAASNEHIERVCVLLRHHDTCDIQGVDPALVLPWHAQRFSQLRNPVLRMGCDTAEERDTWLSAYECLRAQYLPKKAIRAYCLVGFDSDPAEAWDRCEWVTAHGVLVNVQWFHELDALEYNAVTDKQRELGWNEAEQRNIMGWYYQHRGKKGPLK